MSTKNLNKQYVSVACQLKFDSICTVMCHKWILMVILLNNIVQQCTEVLRS